MAVVQCRAANVKVRPTNVKAAFIDTNAMVTVMNVKGKERKYQSLGMGY